MFSKLPFLTLALIVILLHLDARMYGGNNPGGFVAVSREIDSPTATIAYPLERQGELIFKENVFTKGNGLNVTPTGHKYAAQIVVGGASPKYQTHVQFINPKDESRSVMVSLAKGNGEPFVVNVGVDFVPGFPSLPASLMVINLSPKQSMAQTYVALTNPQTVQAGWADFGIPQTCINGICVDDVIVQVVYDVMDNQGRLISMVGVPASAAGSEFWVPIQQTPSIGTGLAIANVGPSPVAVRIEAYSFFLSPIAVANRSLQPGNQSSFFVDEVMQSDPGWMDFIIVFGGSLGQASVRVIVDSGQIALTALRTVSSPAGFIIGGATVGLRQ